MLSDLNKTGMQSPKSQTKAVGFRIGTVKSVGNNGVTVDWGSDTGDEKEYLALSSYSPSVGDMVLAAAVGGTFYILGKVR